MVLKETRKVQRICWIRPSTEAVSYTELLSAKAPHRINQFGQSSELASVTKKQTPAQAARARARQELPQSCRWRSEVAAVHAHANRTIDADQRRAKNDASLTNKTLLSSHTRSPHTRRHYIYQLIMCLAFAKSAYLAPQRREFGRFIGQISCMLEPRARIHSQNYGVLSK